MSVNLEGYDANNYEPQGDFSPIPKGDYDAVIVKSERKATKAGDGAYLQLDWKIIRGEYEGRLLFERLNLWNKNPQAVDIANRTLSSICRAVNIMRPKDSAELHNKPVRLSVDLEERNDKPGSYSNRIKKYSAIGDDAPATKPAAAINESGSKPPWAK